MRFRQGSALTASGAIAPAIRKARAAAGSRGRDVQRIGEPVKRVNVVG
jgi:hypothetical protein